MRHTIASRSIAPRYSLIEDMTVFDPLLGGISTTLGSTLGSTRGSTLPSTLFLIHKQVVRVLMPSFYFRDQRSVSFRKTKLFTSFQINE